MLHISQKTNDKRNKIKINILQKKTIITLSKFDFFLYLALFFNFQNSKFSKNEKNCQNSHELHRINCAKYFEQKNDKINKIKINILQTLNNNYIVKK